MPLNEIRYLEAGNFFIKFKIKVDHEDDEKTYITNELNFFVKNDIKFALLMLSQTVLKINTKSEEIVFSYPEFFDINNKTHTKENSLFKCIIKDFVNCLMLEHKCFSYKSLHKRLKKEKLYNAKKKDLTKIFQDYLSTFDY